MSDGGGEIAAGRTALEEAPVVISINGVTQSVMLATPRDLEVLALGFCLNEGLLQAPEELRDIEVSRLEHGWQADLRVSPRVESRLREYRRLMAGPTGCGLCGIDSLARAISLPAPLAPRPAPGEATVRSARGRLDNHQPLRHRSGGVHGAARFDEAGELIAAAEDVGRHNALDKLCGLLVQQRLTVEGGFVLLTSRCSYDLVVKAARMRIPSLVCFSLPTTLAVETAQKVAVNLLGFQGDRLHIYHEAVNGEP